MFRIAKPLMAAPLIAAVAVLLLAAPFSHAGGSSEKKAAPAAQGAPSANSYFTGDGGKGKSITILPPRSVGLAKDQGYLPDFVANGLVGNFRGFSAMTLFDRVNNQKQYDELFSGYYADDDKAGLDLGHLTSTDYMLLGTITRTSTGYGLQLTINSNSDKTTAASYSGALTIAELDDLSGVGRASLDLLQQMGIQLTERARAELTKAAATDRVNGQAAMAQGIVAQRQGTEVTALTYFYQAAAYDPSLLEAANRSSILNADISSGNIGQNVRNDIEWRNKWLARLTETEQLFAEFNKTQSMPYTLFYKEGITQGDVNYQNETVELSIETNLRPGHAWVYTMGLSMQKTLRAVYDGLQATQRTAVWSLQGWPWRGVTDLNSFAGQSGSFAIDAELLNDRNQVIGRQSFRADGSWGYTYDGNAPADVRVSDDVQKTVYFTVKANDISDRLTIRIARVNGVAPGNTPLRITAVPEKKWTEWITTPIRIKNGVVTEYNTRDMDGNLVIPDSIWGEPITTIGDRTFNDKQLTSVVIPDSVTTIGNSAFDNNKLTSVTIGSSVTTIGDSAFEGISSLWSASQYAGNKLTSVVIPDSVITIGSLAFNGNRLTSVTIGNSVTTIGYAAFMSNQLTSVVIPDSVTSIESNAFSYNQLTSVTIGANVELQTNRQWDSFGKNGFVEAYNNGGKQAGTYTRSNTRSKKWTKQ